MNIKKCRTSVSIYNNMHMGYAFITRIRGSGAVAEEATLAECAGIETLATKIDFVSSKEDTNQDKFSSAVHPSSEYTSGRFKTLSKQ